MISHMRGHTSDMDRIMALCDAAGVPVIEDAAHSLGTVWDGRNMEGHKVAGGIYLALVKSGSSEKIIKVAVER